MTNPVRAVLLKWRLQCLLFCCTCDLVLSQIRYSILEEMERDRPVGNISKDLGIDLRRLSFRGLRIMSEGKKRYFQVNMSNGLLLINEIIDREEICGQSSACNLNVDLLLENPLEMYSLEIEIVDINDNSPFFLEQEVTYNIRESVMLGTRIAVQKAQDRDIGTNSLQMYSLNLNPNFELNVVTHSDKSKPAELILLKPLDREERALHNLVLTAIDGGNPKRSGTTQIIINVIDVNDNVPVFDHEVYRVRLLENVQKGTRVLQLIANDRDEGSNGEVSYYFDKLVSKRVREVFTIEKDTGVLRVQGLVDYEDSTAYEITIEALDGGIFPEAGHCKVIVEIIDINDNAPDVTVSSLSSPIQEDAKAGTVTALITVVDKDSGANGKVSCSVPAWLPFTLQNTFNNYYSLVLKETLDRETMEEYNISIIAEDAGSPPLSTTTVITVRVSDVNDNKPKFTQPSYSVYVMENNIPGIVIFTVSASDSDSNENGHILYSLFGSEYDANCISVNSKTGEVYSLKSFDYEEMKCFQFQVQAKDAGTPSLSSNVSLDLFVLDQNDNSPLIFASQTVGSHLVPRSAQASYLVSKVRAIDADSGYNAWLSYHLLQSTDTSLFKVGQYTGEIRTARYIREGDGKYQTLSVLVRDHGERALSSTATLSISLVENEEKVLPERMQFRSSEKDSSSLNLYLVISIAFISIIFLTTLIISAVVRTKITSNQLKHAQRPYPGTGGSWAYAQNRRYNVCLSAETSKTDFIVFDIQSPNPGGKEEGKDGVSPQNKELMDRENMLVSVSGKPKQPHPDWRYSASLRAGMQSAVHMEESGVLRGGPGGPEQQWPTVSSATLEPEPGEVSPPVGAGVNSNSWTFKYGPGNPKQPVPPIPPDFPDNFIIPGSPAIISIRQDQQPNPRSKGNFITFGKKEETKKRKKKKKGNKNQEKKEKGHSPTDNSDQ